MGCRHEDMRKCSRDITRIGNIKELFSSAQYKNDLVTGDLENLANKSESTFNSVNMNSLKNEERKLNNDMIDILPILITKCENKIQELKNEYRSMSREDSDYHEEQSRKHHHHDD